MALALGAALLLLLCLGWLLSPVAAPPPPPTRNPFGVGAREAAPAMTGLAGWLLQWQAQFYRDMTAAVRAVRESGLALPALMWLGFLYGVVHAAGPGHGKAVISAYILADDRSAARRGFALSLAAALVQAAVAIGLVLTLTVVLRATAATMNLTTRWIELASFAGIAAIGLWLLWSKSAVLIGALAGEAAACAPGCGHVTAAPAGSARSWRDTAAVAVAAGARPCAGAILLLVLTASQGLFWAGVAGTLAMALGVALTTGGLAMLAVLAKGVALRLASGRGDRAAIVIRGLECLAAAAVAVLGLMLLAGYASGLGGA
jgi:nickel/cobalt transporter (NicO) family protein